VATYNKTLRSALPEGDVNFQTFVEFRTWFNGNIAAGDIVNLEVQGGVNFDVSTPFDVAWADTYKNNVTVNMYVKASEAYLGLPRFKKVETVAVSSDSSSIINFSGLLFTNENYAAGGDDDFLDSSETTKCTFENCYLCFRNASLRQFDIGTEVDMNQCVVALVGTVDEATTADFSWRLGSSSELRDCIFVGYRSTGNVKFTDTDSTIDLVDCYLYNYGSQDFVTSGTNSESGVVKDTDPQFAENLIQAVNESSAALGSRDYSLSSSSPIYPFSVYGIGVSPSASPPISETMAPNKLAVKSRRLNTLGVPAPLAEVLLNHYKKKMDTIIREQGK
jgi:hypothetical protein